MPVTTDDLTYDAAFQTAIGGYPLGALIRSAEAQGTRWRSTTDHNVTNPDTGGAGWRMVGVAQQVVP